MDSPMEKFHHYQVLKREDGSLWELGRGAMGITYKAFDTNLRCHVALKVVNSQNIGHDSNTAKMRFVREARAAAALRHPNVASVYHLGNDDQCFFYAMEFVDGITLEALVQRDGPLSCLMALQLTGQVVLALRAAARQELIHRDIKPANLMLVSEEGEEAGEVGIVKVIDFGLAKSTAQLHGDGTPSLTAAGSVQGFIGTAQFASPEQLDEGELDTRSDIYSLGATLWYLLTGKPVFVGPFVAVYSQHMRRPPPLEELTATPECVRALLGRMLQKDPADRPQTPSVLKKEIDDCVQAIRDSGLDPRETRRGAVQKTDGAGKVEEPPTQFIVTGANVSPEPRAASAAGRPSAQAPGWIIPSEFLGMAQAGAVLKLIPKPESSSGAKIGAAVPAMPLHWVARRQIRFGRDREQSDFITWFMPRSTANDQRTRQIGRAALRLEAADDKLWAHNPSELNTVLANGRPVLAGEPCELPLDLPTVFLLNEEYACEALPFRGKGAEPVPIRNLSMWAGSAFPAEPASGTIYAVRLLPIDGQAAFHRLFWLLRQASFGRLQTNALSMDDSSMGDTQGFCSYERGAFWIGSFLDNKAVCLEKTVLAPGVIAPLVSGQTLRLGQSAFDVQVVD
jgi:serine/threonine protein kinase